MSRIIQKNYLGYPINIFMIDRSDNSPSYKDVIIEDMDEYFLRVKMSSGKYQLIAIREIEIIMDK